MTEHKHKESENNEGAVHFSHKKQSGINTNERAILVSAVIIAVAILLHGVLVGQGTGSSQQTTSIVTKEIIAEVMKGNVANRYFNDTLPTEAIVFTEYSDTECPFCKSFHPTISKLVAEGAGKYAWVYKHFPLSFHPKAQKQAEAIECVRSISGDQKALYFLDVIYKVTPGNNKLEDATLFEISDKMKLPTKKIKECVESGTFASKVKADIEEGASKGVQGTPHTIITVGKGADAKVLGVINGAQPREAIEAILSQVK
jgi:protein-disulfide isomerase